MALKAALLSLGCKVNSYETERIREDMEAKGFQIVNFEEKADVYIVNTCSVTNIADRKSRQMLHKARLLNPDALIVATGCYVQTAKDDEKLLDAADIIIGNNHKSDIAQLITEKLSNKTEKKDTNNLLDDIGCEKDVEDLKIFDYPERSRAFVRIEDGCNQFCTYCIIPYARGRVRSRSEEDILTEVRNLAAKGFKEVVITGIHLSSYGISDYEKVNKGEWDHTKLLDLLIKVDAIEGIERIRLGSLEPRIINRDFAIALKNLKSFCPHFHLSLQSGCDTVLKRMNRHYTASEFLERVTILREVFDRPAITTDVITGFPGETEEEFEEGLKMLETASFSKMHIFKYSRRKGTVADRMQGQLTDRVKHERSLVLQKLDDENHLHYASTFVGQEVNVLIEEEKDGVLTGLTERYLTVKTKNRNNLATINSIVKVRVKEVEKDGIITGEIIF